MSGESIRKFFRDLLGSRLAETLELQIVHMRSDFEARLHDKDLVISQLRSEKAALEGKAIVYENALFARTSQAGADVVRARGEKPTKPNFANLPSGVVETKTRWQLAQEEHYKQELAEELAKEEAKKSQPATV